MIELYTYQKGSRFIMNVVDYKSIIESYNILVDNKKELKKTFYTWGFALKLTPVDIIVYIIYPFMVENKMIYLTEMNKILFEMNKIKKVIYKSYKSRYFDGDLFTKFINDGYWGNNKGKVGRMIKVGAANPNWEFAIKRLNDTKVGKWRYIQY